MVAVAVPIPNPFRTPRDGPPGVCRLKYDRLIRYLKRNPEQVARVYPRLKRVA